MYSSFMLSSSTFFFPISAPALRFMLSVQGLRKGLNHSGGSFFFFLSFSCHLCLCLCLSQIRQADNKALFHPCSSSRGWHEKPAMSDTLLLTNRRSQYVHISFWGRYGVRWRERGLELLSRRKQEKFLDFALSLLHFLSFVKLGAGWLCCNYPECVSCYHSAFSVDISSVWSNLKCFDIKMNCHKFCDSLSCCKDKNRCIIYWIGLTAVTDTTVLMLIISVMAKANKAAAAQYQHHVHVGQVIRVDVNMLTCNSKVASVASWFVMWFVQKAILKLRLCHRFFLNVLNILTTKCWTLPCKQTEILSYNKEESHCNKQWYDQTWALVFKQPTGFEIEMECGKMQ